MSDKSKPVAVNASEVPPRVRPSVYPEPYASRMAGRVKRHLGDFFNLANFGVNLTHLSPNAVSSLRHAHTGKMNCLYPRRLSNTAYGRG